MRALVQIEGDADTGALTNSEGQFEIPGVPAGPQIIRVAKPGYRDRPYATEEDGLQAEGPAHSVMLAAQMPELAFALAPNNAIHGRIELSTSDPADGLTVVLLKQVVRFGRGLWTQITNVKTNGDGAYRFGGLSDGVYAIYTHPALESEPAVSVVAAGTGANIARSGFPSVYYPDARDFAGASRIRLSGGSQAEANFSLTLEPFYPVTAFGVSPGAGSAGKMAPGNNSVVMDASGHVLPYFPQYDPATHSMQVSLPDGTHSMLIHVLPRGELTSESLSAFPLDSRPSRGLAGAVQFTVAGHAVPRLRIPLGAPSLATVHLRIVHNAENPAALPVAANNAAELVNLTMDPADDVPLNSGETVWSMENGPDTITLSAQPGSYWLSANLPRQGLCAGSFTAGSVNLAREPLVLSLAAAPPPMELTLRDDCATLVLTLPAAQAAFLPGEEPFYTVYVVPDFDTVQDIPPMAVHPSSGPTLTVNGLTPGSYHVYIFDSPVHLEYRNPTALAALPNPGQQVTLAAGTTANLTLEAPER
jgi:hypothetical protein